MIHVRTSRCTYVLQGTVDGEQNYVIGQRFFECCRRINRGDIPVVNYRDAVTELFDILNVMSGQNDRHVNFLVHPLDISPSIPEDSRI